MSTPAVDPDDVVAFTLRLPKDDHRWLRREAFEQDTNMNAIVVTLIRKLREESEATTP